MSVALRQVIMLTTGLRSGCPALPDSLIVDCFEYGHSGGARRAMAARRRLDDATSKAIGSGIWGSPFVIVDDEPFWGEDRLDQVDIWLQRGGW